MLKLAVFDDEYIVLEGLQKMINWPQYGIELIGTATDGLSALELFRAARPDIILTDIRMPGLDGLKLIEAILLEAPETMCIVFSGFNEYEYVKNAIKLGVVDYLEKPITIAKVEESIVKTIERISRQKEVSALKLQWEESKRDLLEKAALDLLMIGAEAEEKFKYSLGFDASLIVGVTVLAFTAYMEPFQGHPSYRTIYLRNGSERLLVVLHFNLPATEFWEYLSDLSEYKREGIGSGQTYADLADTCKSYREALRALRYGSFLEEREWMRYEELGEYLNVSEGISLREEAVIFFIRTGDKEGFMLELDGFIHWLESEKLAPEILEREVLKLVYLGLEVAKETGGDVDQMWWSGYLPHIELREMRTREEILRWLRKQMEMILNWILNIRHSNKHAAVEKAITFINSNFHRDISLQELAELINMNSTYFSLLFKEQVGISYIKYLTKVRLDKAKLLLLDGMLVNEVSEKVGYYNYRHFSEQFKKNVGVPPGHYRDANKNK